MFLVKVRKLIVVAATLSILIPGAVHADPYYLTPGPDTSKDIWTTSVYSYTASGGGPGGGLLDGQLRVGGWADLYYSLIQFDLSTLPVSASSAVLQLYDMDSNTGTPTGLYLNQITTPWDWTTQPITPLSPDQQRLWWVNRPASVQVSGPLPAPTVGSFYTIDITNLYNSWQSGAIANYGLMLTPTNNANNFDDFASSRNLDAPFRPTLIVEPGVPVVPTVPIPDTLPLVLSGLGVLALVARRRSQQDS